jgi:glucose/arabinose dehydrogenase
VARDTGGDAGADVVRYVVVGRSGSGIALQGGFLYFATDEAVVRWPWRSGQLEPDRAPDTVVSGLVAHGEHAAKSIAVTRDGRLFVNIGAPSNSCQVEDRGRLSPGRDPCPLLDSAGGIWLFDTRRLHQRQGDGRRWATGLRNVVSLSLDPSEVPWGVMHGRDQLGDNWPQLYDARRSAELPAEELFRIEEGRDYGWPYCYYDGLQRKLVLAPEYGGDGRSEGRCAEKEQPLLAFPAHWAPDATVFYSGSQFPAAYRGGLFVAFHGSWNRAPLPQEGYNVVFAPLAGGRPAGTYEVFADGFRGGSARAASRPTGLAVGPDGSLYVSDDRGGRVYRIIYAGRER